MIEAKRGRNGRRPSGRLFHGCSLRTERPWGEIGNSFWEIVFGNSFGRFLNGVLNVVWEACMFFGKCGKCGLVLRDRTRLGRSADTALYTEEVHKRKYREEEFVPEEFHRFFCHTNVTYSRYYSYRLTLNVYNIVSNRSIYGWVSYSLLYLSNSLSRPILHFTRKFLWL